jgi:predicted GH43/DUF377 family glycosyl hydrolase
MKGMLGIPDERAAQIDEKMKTAYPSVQKNGPYESWKLTNNNANIKRIRIRIARLERMANNAPQGWEFDGGKVVVNTDENRLQIIFESKPDENVRGELKSNGFRWAPSQGAWQRQLTDNALRAARRMKSVQPTVQPTA